jgi:hypothetical protein
MTKSFLPFFPFSSSRFSSSFLSFPTYFVPFLLHFHLPSPLPFISTFPPSPFAFPHSFPPSLFPPILFTFPPHPFPHSFTPCLPPSFPPSLPPSLVPFHLSISSYPSLLSPLLIPLHTSTSLSDNA